MDPAPVAAQIDRLVDQLRQAHAGLLALPGGQRLESGVVAVLVAALVCRRRDFGETADVAALEDLQSAVYRRDRPFTAREAGGRLGRPAADVLLAVRTDPLRFVRVATADDPLDETWRPTTDEEFDLLSMPSVRPPARPEPSEPPDPSPRRSLAITVARMAAVLTDGRPRSAAELTWETGITTSRVWYAIKRASETIRPAGRRADGTGRQPLLLWQLAAPVSRPVPLAPG